MKSKIKVFGNLNRALKWAKVPLLIIVLVAVIGFSLAACKETSKGPVLTIVNNTGYPIWYVLICLSTDPDIGDDWLGPSEVIYNYGTRSFTLPGTGTYDVMLLAYQGTSAFRFYAKLNVPINENKTLTFNSSDFVTTITPSVHNERMELLNRTVPGLPNKD